MAIPDRSHALDHVVVIMFENRSFDNVLGALYDPTEKPGFEGVLGRDLSNPIPPGVPGAERGIVPVHPATDMDTPDPDPGEEHPHVNTQLYNTVSPASNATLSIRDMRPPFNAPPSTSTDPTMQGFVTDYVNAFQAEMGRPPRYEEYAGIMAYYTPDQLPVLSTLARGFAVFDHWFCEVPSQTYCNRSFVHAASSSGYVNNSPVGTFEAHNDAPTIFERLEEKGLSWKVYIDPRQLVPATGLIHARRLLPKFADRFRGMDEFYDNVRQGTLPPYSFIEPNMLHPHTDMHPPGACRLRHDLGIKSPNAMLGGEQLLANVYGAIKGSASESGSNWANTLLLVTFDEHGGTFDHVPPPRVPPATAPTGTEEEGFRFDRSGVRVPAIAVSAWVDGGTVVSQEFRHTSVIRTLRERWDLGPPLTGRDAVAADITPHLARTVPRPPDAWPKVFPRPLGLLARAEDEVDLRFLACLENNLVGEALAHESRVSCRPLAGDVESMKIRAAQAHLARIQAASFPGVTRGGGR